MLSMLLVFAITYSDVGLPDPVVLSQKAIDVVETRLPEITAVAISIYIVRRTLNNL